MAAVFHLSRFQLYTSDSACDASRGACMSNSDNYELTH